MRSFLKMRDILSSEMHGTDILSDYEKKTFLLGPPYCVQMPEKSRAMPRSIWSFSATVPPRPVRIKLGGRIEPDMGRIEPA